MGMLFSRLGHSGGAGLSGRHLTVWDLIKIELGIQMPFGCTLHMCEKKRLIFLSEYFCPYHVMI